MLEHSASLVLDVLLVSNKALRGRCDHQGNVYGLETFKEFGIARF